jgi:DNA repair exonuclease SbcCD ATPase subunit
MITFNKIRWSNFLSTGQYPTEVDLTSANTTLITGENGAGKSTLLDALTFALFGKPYRNINKPQIVNSVNEKNCIVELEFDIAADKYKVRRGLEPALFEIFKNGEIINQDAKSKDYQRMFEEQILRQTYKSFCQVAILGSANYTAFMELTAADRRAVVESILDINIFSQMNALLKTKQSQVKEELTIMEADLTVLREKIKLNEKYLQSREKDTDHKIDDYKEEITRCKEDETRLLADIQTLREEISVLVETITDTDTVNKTIYDLSSINRQLKSKIKTLESEVDFYNKNDTCPTCIQKIDDTFRKNIITTKNNKISEVGKAVEDIAEQSENTSKRLQEIQAISVKIKSLEGKVSDMSASLRSTEVTRKKFERLLTESETSKATEDKSEENALVELRKQLEEMEAERKEMVENQYYYGVAANLLKDSGIKSRIIKHYIPIINQIINRYLNQMGLFVSFNLDEEFKETIKSRHRDTFTYASFSEGEKRKIDLSLLFAWRAIAGIKNSINTNLLIMDEVLDGSLDDSSVESFLDILKNMNSAINIFVISHKPKELLESKFQRHIQFAKKGNFSARV